MPEQTIFSIIDFLKHKSLFFVHLSAGFLACRVLKAKKNLRIRNFFQFYSTRKTCEKRRFLRQNLAEFFYWTVFCDSFPRWVFSKGDQKVCFRYRHSMQFYGLSILTCLISWLDLTPFAINLLSVLTPVVSDCHNWEVSCTTVTPNTEQVWVKYPD